jgi:hypothetical protein
MRWDHLAPTAPEAVREAHRLLGIATEALAAIVLANGDDTTNPGRLRIAVNRVERARRVLETGTQQWLAGQCIHYGEHRYVSTYCQHALAQEAEHGLSDDADGLHARCRLACKVCDQPCRCPAPHCPCRAARDRAAAHVARNPGNVGGVTPTTQEDTHGQGT